MAVLVKEVAYLSARLCPTFRQLASGSYHTDFNSRSNCHAHCLLEGCLRNFASPFLTLSVFVLLGREIICFIPVFEKFIELEHGLFILLRKFHDASEHEVDFWIG